MVGAGVGYLVPQALQYHDAYHPKKIRIGHDRPQASLLTFSSVYCLAAYLALELIEELPLSELLVLLVQDFNVAWGQQEELVGYRSYPTT